MNEKKINADGFEIPEYTIAIIPSKNMTRERLKNVLEPLSGIKQRDWFAPQFYRCLPLTVGNQQGFIIKSEYAFTAMWDGGTSAEATKFSFDVPVEETFDLFPTIKSHFGYGIITIDAPCIFRTPPKVNLMTINPPNYVLPNITVMTGVIETDNLRYYFTFNLKLQDPNVAVHFPAGTPLAAFIPVPRYYTDKFELKYVEDIFDKEMVDIEMKAAKDNGANRERLENSEGLPYDRQYLRGIDVYGNKFDDHQRG